MRRTPPLRAEPLEPRDTPATFGTPWPDAQHLTLSFAPDGTAVDGRPSDLGTLLAGLDPATRTEMLRAFQTWAVQAGVNIGLVADDGTAFGSGRAVQGDPRFGDVRVGGLPLPADVLAVTTPYALFNNYSGDVVVNTAAGFGPGGYDPYTVLLHEAGHALGLPDNTDPTSVMDGIYLGPRTGLSAGDVAAIRALYGPRQADSFEGPAGNGTPAAATQYSGPLTADLSSPQDVDVYKFVPGLLTSGVTIQLGAAGLSLVTARVDLLDAAGHVLASAATTDPTDNDVTLSLDGVTAGATYYVRVSAARADAFGVGAYSLEVDQKSLLTGLTGLLGGVLNVLGLNTSPATATAVPARDSEAEYSADGRFLFPSVTNYFQVVVPATAAGPQNLLLTVWGQNGTVLDPWVEVDDVFGNKLAAQVLTADGNTTTIQAVGLAPGQAYMLKISSDTGAVGDYHLSGTLTTDTVTFPAGGSGTLTAPAPAADAVLTLPESGQVHFVLAADGTSSAGRAAELIVTAADGTVVADLVAPVGRGRSVDVFLPAGEYRVEVRSVNPCDPVAFTLGVAVVTDPVGPTPTDPTGTPEPPPSDTSTSPPPPPPPSDQTQTSGTTALAPTSPDETAYWF